LDTRIIPENMTKGVASDPVKVLRWTEPSSFRRQTQFVSCGGFKSHPSQFVACADKFSAAFKHSLLVMPRRPDNLETLHLSLELLKRIPRQRKIDSRDLQLQFKEAGYDRDVRTIQRQLESL
jgi:hypothetical protein